MIEIQEYLDAGFTPEQARLLVARDRRIDDRFELLHGAMNRGFADVLSTMAQLARQVADGFEAQDHRFDAVTDRLEGIDRHFQAPPEASA